MLNTVTNKKDWVCKRIIHLIHKYTFPVFGKIFPINNYKAINNQYITTQINLLCYYFNLTKLIFLFKYSIYFSKIHFE